MTFEDFQGLLSRIYEGAPPSHLLARDLFDLLDLKQDGFLDAHEWSHAFALAKPLAQERFLTHKP